jgi:hypothetical protein
MTSSSARSTATTRSTTIFGCRIPGATYSFYGLDNFASGKYFDYDLQTNPTNPDAIPARYANKNLGLFVQDSWYFSPNLTLSFGIRADKPDTDPQPEFNACFATPRVANNTGPTTCPNGGFGLDNSNTYNGDFIIQPRFGFNYTFDWDRPTQLRGGIGLFQGDAPQVWTSNSYQSTGLNFLSYQNITDFANVPFTPDGLNPNIPARGNAVRNVNVIANDFELPSVWKANLAFDHELPWWGMVATAELLVTEVENGLFYNSLNLGPGYLGPDGRALFWNPSAPNFLSTANNRFGRNSFFGDVFLLENTNKGRSQQLTLLLNKPYTGDSDWSWSAGYTYTNTDEAGALTSSTAGSGFGSQYNFSTNEELANTARYEIKNRFTGALNWRHAFFGDYATSVGLFYEGRSGRPFSYIFSGDANGDNRTFNDLFYVPAGRGDVLFGTISNSGVFTANPVAENAFFTWLAGRPGPGGLCRHLCAGKWFPRRLGQHLRPALQPGAARLLQGAQVGAVARHPERGQPDQQGLGPRDRLRLQRQPGRGVAGRHPPGSLRLQLPRRDRVRPGHGAGRPDRRRRPDQRHLAVVAAGRLPLQVLSRL